MRKTKLENYICNHGIRFMEEQHEEKEAEQKEKEETHEGKKKERKDKEETHEEKKTEQNDKEDKAANDATTVLTVMNL